MGTTANLTVFALLRGQPMLRRPYLGIGEATKQQAVAAWNALPSRRRHFGAIDGRSGQRTEQNHGVKHSSCSSYRGGLPICRLLGRNGFKCYRYFSVKRPDPIRLTLRQGRVLRRETRMYWTTPTFVEICVGLEINCY